MAGYNAAEALDLITENSFEGLDSGGEEDIDEDPAFPVPSQESEVSGDSDLEGNKKNKRKYNRT